MVKESSTLEILSIQLHKHLSKAYMGILGKATYYTYVLTSKDIVEFYLVLQTENRMAEPR